MAHSSVQRLLAPGSSWGPLAFAMLVAIFAVHIDKGLFVTNNGYEFGLALLAVAVSLVFTGAGRASLDAALSARSAPR